ncbi:spherulation-specific family 4 protein [Streptomyces sp. NPDC005840]|uniref:spherulation-specific family 4 protein n=1 Tax=unclassified Streptomyces TaxID=2593676 RepID=UPI003402CFA6
MTRPSPSAVTGVLLALTAAWAVTAAPADAAPAAPQDTLAAAQKVSVPAYFAPGALWNRLGQGAGTVGLAVANPDSGPGAGDAQYTSAITAAHNAGVTVIGYVRTGYFGSTGITTKSGSTDPAEWMRQIKSEVDTWYRLYGSAGLGGIFFDEGQNDCGPGNANVNRYTELRSYVESRHGASSVVVDNPGTGAAQCYTAAADTLVTFEGSAATYRTFQPQAWEAGASPDKIWHLVYESPDETSLRSTMALARQRNAGHVYVTPDTLAGNPWDSLPPESYWNTELSLARSAG